MVKGCGDSGFGTSYSFGGGQSNQKVSMVNSNVRDDRDKNCEELTTGVGSGPCEIGQNHSIGQPKSFTIQNLKKNEFQTGDPKSRSPDPKIFSQSFNYGLPYERPTTA